jgi:hypothetical protein
MMDGIHFSETCVLTIVTRFHIPQDRILPSQLRENLKSYMRVLCFHSNTVLHESTNLQLRSPVQTDRPQWMIRPLKPRGKSRGCYHYIWIGEIMMTTHETIPSLKTTRAGCCSTFCPSSSWRPRGTCRWGNVPCSVSHLNSYLAVCSSEKWGPVTRTRLPLVDPHNRDVKHAILTINKCIQNFYEKKFLLK